MKSNHLILINHIELYYVVGRKIIILISNVYYLLKNNWVFFINTGRLEPLKWAWIGCSLVTFINHPPCIWALQSMSPSMASRKLKRNPHAQLTNACGRLSAPHAAYSLYVLTSQSILNNSSPRGELTCDCLWRALANFYFLNNKRLNNNKI